MSRDPFEEGAMSFDLGLPESFSLSEDEPAFGEAPLMYPRTCSRCGEEFEVTAREQAEIPADSAWCLCDGCTMLLVQGNFSNAEMQELGFH
jgi:hypothetical protein